MELGTLLFLLLILACPLMMLWMMRGHGGGHGHMHRPVDEGPALLDELRERRAELDAEIAQREPSESETKTPAAV